jgi:phosphoribosylanthranilate isomerase
LKTFVITSFFDTKENYLAATDFDWNVLQALSFIKTVLLSGGIGLEEIAAVNEITKTNLPFMPLM